MAKQEAQKVDMRQYDKAPPPALENPAREALYAEYEKLATPPEPTEEEAAASPEAEVQEDSPVQESAEYVAEEGKESKQEDKTVPYGALKEEREKRKALATKVDDLSGQVKQLIEDNRKLMEREKPSVEDKEEPEAEITDYDSEIISLRKQVRELSKSLKNTSTTVSSDIQARQNQDLESKARKVDTDLEKEGIPGFYNLIPQVIAKLQELKDPSLYNEAGWAKVYKEHVYPNVIGKYAKPAEPPPDKKAEKKALKQDLKMVKSPGKPIAEPKEDDEKDWDFNSYLKLRNSHSVFQ